MKSFIGMVIGSVFQLAAQLTNYVVLTVMYLPVIPIVVYQKLTQKKNNNTKTRRPISPIK